LCWPAIGAIEDRDCGLVLHRLASSMAHQPD
jgi:hypothetical protein